MSRRSRVKSSLKSMFPKNFLAQVAGASTMGLIEAALEVYSPELFGEPNRVSAANPPLFTEPLLPVEKWVILPVGGLIGAVAQKYSRKAGVKAFSEGMMLYAMPRIVDREIVRTVQASARGWAPPV